MRYSRFCVSATVLLSFLACVVAYDHHIREAEQKSIGMLFGLNNPQHVTEGNNHVCRPPEVSLDVEGYPLAPHDMKLEQVHVFVRHGERAPVGVRLSRGPAPIPEHWMMCKAARRFGKSALIGMAEDLGGFLGKNVTLERVDGRIAEGEWCVTFFFSHSVSQVVNT